MLAQSTTSSLLAPLLFLAAVHALTQPAQAEQSGKEPFPTYVPGSHDLQEWAVEDGRGKVKSQTPVAVRKMMGQEAEMFFQEFWQFEQDDPQASFSSNALHEPATWPNSSKLLPFFAPIARHHASDASSFPIRWARGLVPQLHSRAFQCPTNTNACTTINRPNSCCPLGDTCQLVTNTGQGEVACCGNGQTCAGNVQDCANGYQSCPSNEGGGCCLPGYACVGTIGCERS